MSEAHRHLSFVLAGRRHAIPMACIQELLYIPMLQPTERVPGHILGIFNLRGEPVPVLDLARLLGLDSRPLNEEDVMLVFHSPSGAGPFGLLLEAVEDLLAFDPAELRLPMDDPEAENRSPLVTWLGFKEERLYHLLDLDLVVAGALAGTGPDRYEEVFAALPSVLKERLQARAEWAAGLQGDGAGSLSSCLEFRLGGERFLLPLKANLQITPCPPIFPVPGAPPAVLGLANLGGEPLLVVDLRPLLDMPSGTLLPQAHLLVVEDGAGILGLYADDVGEVLDLDPEAVQVHPANTAKPLVQGEWLADGLVFHMLDVPLLLAHPGLTLSPTPTSEVP